MILIQRITLGVLIKKYGGDVKSVVTSGELPYQIKLMALAVLYVQGRRLLILVVRMLLKQVSMIFILLILILQKNGITRKTTH